MQKCPKLGGFPDIPLCHPAKAGRAKPVFAKGKNDVPPQKTEPFLRKVSFFEVAWLKLGYADAIFSAKTFRFPAKLSYLGSPIAG